MDWQLTCRVCLETGDMVSLFDWDENNEQLGDKYTYCCGVEVSKNDSLPTLICLNCVDRLTYACQFKQQCLSSNETLKECLDEFLKTSAAVSANKSDEGNETETITIKQENGLLLQYELPVEHDPQGQWTRTIIKTPNAAVVTKAPGRRKRGRPRKYPNEQGQIDVSPYQRKKPKPENKEPEALTTLLASGSLDLKQEPDEEEQDHYVTEELDTGDDPDFVPGGDEPDSDVESKKEIINTRNNGNINSSGTRKYGLSYSEETLEMALDLIKIHNMSQRQASKFYGIPRSTLQYRLNKNKLNSPVKKKTGRSPRRRQRR